MKPFKKCLSCGKELEGRYDKKFCDPYCKSSYHYQRNVQNETAFYKNIDKQLKLNRRLLKNFNKAGKAIVRLDELVAEGFNPNYFTHYWKTAKEDVYLFVYEYGFLKRKENNIEKYVLIKWQDYMEK